MEALEYSISDCETSKPDVRPRKSKPEAMFWRRRFSATLLITHQPTSDDRHQQHDLVDDLAHLGAIEEPRQPAARLGRRLVETAIAYRIDGAS